MSFFIELKRRKIFRVAAVYLVVAWLLIQVTSTVLPTFDTPAWVNQTITFLFFLGFPITLIMAWAYEVTPDGIKPDSVAQAYQPVIQTSDRKLIYAVLVLVLVVAGLQVSDRFSSETAITTIETNGVRRFIHLIPAVRTQPTFSIAPDGNAFAYSSDSILYLRQMDELEARELAGMEGERATKPVFSPDGEWISYWSRSDELLKRVPTQGGTPIAIGEVSGTFLGWSWVDDETIYYSATPERCEIWQVAVSDGLSELLVENDDYRCIEPTLLPGSDTLIYEQRSLENQNPEIVVQSLTSGEKTVLFSGYQVYYIESGHLVYVSPELNLMARTFDPDTFELGTPAQLDDQFYVKRALAPGKYAISPSGNNLVYMKEPTDTLASDSILAIADERGIIKSLDAPPRIYTNPVVSPDGSQVAVSSLDIDGVIGSDIYIYNLSNDSELRQLTFGGASDYSTWSPDGQWVIYTTGIDDDSAIVVRKRADGSGDVEALTSYSQGRYHAWPVWTPDGRLAYTDMNTRAAYGEIWVMTIPDGIPELLVGGEGLKFKLSFSPFGDAMAYCSSESLFASAFEVYAEPYPPVNGSIYRISDDGCNPYWTSSGKIHYQSNGFDFSLNIETVEISLPSFALSNRQELPFDVNGSGLNNLGKSSYPMPGTDHMVILTGGDNDDSIEVVIVENLLEEIERLVPKE